MGEPVGISFDFPEETRQIMIPGELTYIEGGMYQLVFQQLPKLLCAVIERELNIRSIFAMACVVEEDILGTVAVMSHEGGRELRNKNLIESVVNQAALAIKRKRAEDDLSARAEELAAVNKELEAFSYSVTHDIRAPLSLLKGFSGILEEEYFDKLDETGRDYLHRITNSAEEMERLVDDILSLSRVAREKMTLQEIDMSAIVSSIVDNLRASNPQRNVNFSIGQVAGAYGDPRLITIAHTNLFGNAWKYTAKIKKATIEFGSIIKDEQTVYFIRDNGVGFNMEFAEKLFLPFERLHSEREFPGTGIGLAITERVIRIKASNGLEVWCKPLGAANGADKAVALLNRNSSVKEITVTFSDILLSGTVKVRDLWAKADRGSFTGSYKMSVPSHGTGMLIFTSGILGAQRRTVVLGSNRFKTEFSNGKIVIMPQGNNSQFSVSVFGFDGRLVTSQEGSREIVNVPVRSRGIYIVNVKCNGHS